jgi:hypothetical protein
MHKKMLAAVTETEWRAKTLLDAAAVQASVVPWHGIGCWTFVE